MLQLQYELTVITKTGNLEYYGYKDGESGEVSHGDNKLPEERLWVKASQLNVVIDNILADTDSMGWRTNKNGATEIAIDFSVVEV